MLELIISSVCIIIVAIYFLVWSLTIHDEDLKNWKYMLGLIGVFMLFALHYSLFTPYPVSVQLYIYLLPLLILSILLGIEIIRK